MVNVSTCDPDTLTTRLSVFPVERSSGIARLCFARVPNWNAVRTPGSASQPDLTRLAAAQEDAAAGVERPELGGALLPRDEIESVSLLTLDRRRIVVETICWTALLITLGYAGLSQ